MRLAGIIALSDPPRTDAAELIKELHTLGVRMVMVTGDAPATAAIIAQEVGLEGAVCPPGPIPASVRPEEFAVFAGVLPRTSITSCRRFRRADTPSACAAMAPMMRLRCARRRWELQFPVATDVAKSAAGIVLTKPDSKVLWLR